MRARAEDLGSITSSSLTAWKVTLTGDRFCSVVGYHSRIHVACPGDKIDRKGQDDTCIRGPDGWSLGKVRFTFY